MEYSAHMWAQHPRECKAVLVMSGLVAGGHRVASARWTNSIGPESTNDATKTVAHFLDPREDICSSRGGGRGGGRTSVLRLIVGIARSAIHIDDTSRSTDSSLSPRSTLPWGRVASGGGHRNRACRALCG